MNKKQLISYKDALISKFQNLRYLVLGVFGTIEKPAGVDRFGSDGENGILIFISNLLQLATVVAGLWVLLNFILAGFEYISSQGDSGAHAKVREKITNSVIGLVIIAISYTLVAVIGLILFGDAAYFLNPTLIGAGTAPTP